MKKRIWLVVLLGLLGNHAYAESLDILELNSLIPSEGTDYTYISGFDFINKKVFYEKKSGMAHPGSPSCAPRDSRRARTGR